MVGKEGMDLCLGLFQYSSVADIMQIMYEGKVSFLKYWRGRGERDEDTDLQDFKINLHFNAMLQPKEKSRRLVIA